MPEGTMTAAAGESAARLRLLLARMALAAAALTFVVIVASAFMRHAQAGLSCGEWPACYARMVTPDADRVPDAGVRLARIAHRLAATGVLALVLGMLLIAWTQTPRWKREGALALGAFVIAVGLAVLGLATPGARLPAITLGNLLGGYAMLAVLAAATASAGAASAGTRHLARLALGFVLVQAALGGMIGAQFASLACPTLTDCGAWSWTAFVCGESWNPLRGAELSDGHLVAPDGAAGLHVLHRLNGMATATLVVATAALLRGSQPRLALTLAGLAVIAAALGTAVVSVRQALVWVVAHNASAALLVALLARTSSRGMVGGGTDRESRPLRAAANARGTAAAHAVSGPRSRARTP